MTISKSLIPNTVKKESLGYTLLILFKGILLFKIDIKCVKGNNVNYIDDSIVR